ncbi:hypothetical protein PYCC9005_002533 [Savitreella phatthalungensis]
MSKASNMMRWGRKDPELYVLASIYAAIFGAAGYHLGKKGGNAKPEANVQIPQEGMPWHQDGEGEEGGNFKYLYHPGGDPRNPPKEAPGALHSHTVMASLPKDLYEKFNKSID